MRPWFQMRSFLLLFSWLRRTPIALLAVLLSASAAYADWRSEIGIFRVGIVTGNQTIDFLARAEPFRLALSEALDMEVEFFTARNTEAAIDAIRSDRIEYAVLSASAYGIAWRLCECVEPIAMPRSADSTDGYHAIMITREGGPETIEALAGKQIAQLSASGLSQSLLWKAHLLEQNLAIENFPLISEASGEETLTQFVNGKFDALLGWSSMSGNPSDGYSRGTLRHISSLIGGQPTGFRVLWKSEQMPHRTHAVRRKLPGETKNILRNFLLGLFDRNPVAYDSIEPIYGGGFVTARHGRYQPLIKGLERYTEAHLEVSQQEEEEGSTPLDATKNPPD